MPEYTFRQEGKDHIPVFSATCAFARFQQLAQGAASKKAAKHAAAAAMVQFLRSGAAGAGIAS